MNVHDLSLNLTEALLRTTTQEAPTDKLEDRLPFTITISREVGALGTMIGTAIGKRLDWPVYDQELIHKVAEEIDRPTFHVRGIDEKPVSWLEDVFSNLVSEYHVSSSAYLKTLIGIVRGLGAMGKCIIVGRGANFILPRETTLRVRLVANLEDRITVIGRLRGISDREAGRWIEKTEEDRIQFATKTFGKDPTNPHFYDLVLNTSFVGVEEAAEIIVDTLHLFEKRCSGPFVREPEPLAIG